MGEAKRRRDAEIKAGIESLIETIQKVPASTPDVFYFYGYRWPLSPDVPEWVHEKARVLLEQLGVDREAE